MKVFDTIVIGGGQYGLYSAKKLAEKNITYQVIEADKLGAVWRKRLKSMRLFTSRKYSSMPGLVFKGDPKGFPSVEEMADYLVSYAKKFNINVRENAKVESLVKNNNKFVITLANGETIQTKTVINGTGANQVCIIPKIAAGLSKKVVQLTADTHSFDELPENQNILVVGGGASGRQIAALLNKKGHEITLSCSGTRKYPPKKILGQDFFFWLKLFRIIFADKNSFIAKIIKSRNPVPCREVNNKRLKNINVNIVGKTLSCEGERVTFESGENMIVDMVIWCVGYQDNTEWMNLEHCIERGEFIDNYGVTPEPGLFIVGRKWLTCRASELVMGVEKDVSLIINKLTDYLAR